MKYPQGSMLRHLKTGNVYMVLNLPGVPVVIEETGEKAYEYRKVDSGLLTGPIVVRSVTKMEDGRFELVTGKDNEKADPTA